MKKFEGKFNGKGIKIGIVAGRFNEFITSKLVGGAVDVLKRNDVNDEDIDIAWVPGAFEIPLITKKMAESKKYDAIMFGVLTTNNIEEAIERAGTKAGNKGSDVAFGALEMIDLIKNIG